MTTYHVSKSGSDRSDSNPRNDGSRQDPFRSIERALDEDLGAGDTVVVHRGIFRENVWIDQGGSSRGYFKLKGMDGAVIDASGHGKRSGIQIADDYVEVSGFEVRDSGRSGISSIGTHHIRVLDNETHHNQRSGIYLAQGEHYLIEGNETHHNAISNPSSGISVHRPKDIGGDRPLEGKYEIVIRDNVSHDNVTRRGGKHTDGNGIILDDWRTTKYPDQPAYDGHGLVEDNFVYRNGGSGIRAVWTDGATIRDNLAWHNSQDTERLHSLRRGDLSNAHSSDNEWIGNVAIADTSGGKANNRAIINVSSADYTNHNVVWEDNFTFNGRAGQVSVLIGDGDGAIPRDENHLGVDPRFLVGGDDFRFHAFSPVPWSDDWHF